VVVSGHRWCIPTTSVVVRFAWTRLAATSAAAFVSGEPNRVPAVPKVGWGLSIRGASRKGGASLRQPSNQNLSSKSGSRVAPRRVATEGRWPRPARGLRRPHTGGNTCEQLGEADRDRLRCAVIVVGGVDWPRVPPFAVVAEVERLTRRPRSRSGCRLCVTVQALHSGQSSQVLSRKVASVDWWRGIRWWRHQWCEPSGCAVRRETLLVRGQSDAWRASFGVRTVRRTPFGVWTGRRAFRLGCEPFGERPSGCGPGGEHSSGANCAASALRGVNRVASTHRVRTARRVPFGVRTVSGALIGCEPYGEHSAGANRAASTLRGASCVASVLWARTARRALSGV
jgi:hypothetical protein